MQALETNRRALLLCLGAAALITEEDLDRFVAALPIASGNRAG